MVSALWLVASSIAVLLLLWLPRCCRDVSRQEYLKKREEAKLEELKEALEDVKYLFQVRWWCWWWLRCWWRWADAARVWGAVVGHALVLWGFLCSAAC